MTNSKSIYQDTTNGVEDQYLVYILYREDHIPHYVGATKYSTRPYDDRHHARKDHNITSVEIVQEDLSREDASKLEDQLINEYGKTIDGGTLVNVQDGGHGLITHTDETKTKISLAMAKKGRKRKPFSDEHKARISLAMAGRKRKPFSNEHKAKMSASQKGRTVSDETKTKISLAKKGKTMSDEHRAILSAKTKEYWARRKQSSLK